MKKAIATLLMLISPIAMAGSYEAVISCGMNGQNINVLACFKDTDLKITKDGSSVVYKIYNLQSAGQTYQDGLHIDLPEHFSIKAQNSQDHLVLGVKITDKNGKTVFEDQAGKWDVISVGN